MASVEFVACNKAVTWRSSKWFWSSKYAVLWGHFPNNDACEGILVDRVNFNRFLIKANESPATWTETYKMNIHLVKRWWGSFYHIDPESVCKFGVRRCPPK